MRRERERDLRSSWRPPWLGALDERITAQLSTAQLEEQKAFQCGDGTQKWQRRSSFIQGRGLGFTTLLYRSVWLQVSAILRHESG
jgi:hypothetical protein